MCTEKTIKLSLDQARKMYGKNPEMDELLLANFSKEELTKKELPKSWYKLNGIKGYFVNSDAGIEEYLTDGNDAESHERNIFSTKKQARSCLAMAQLSQLMAIYNDGWEFNPKCNESSRGYYLERKITRINKNDSMINWSFLAFKSSEIRDEFLKNFEQLIKEYFMID